MTEQRHILWPEFTRWAMGQFLTKSGFCTQVNRGEWIMYWDCFLSGVKTGEMIAQEVR